MILIYNDDGVDPKSLAHLDKYMNELFGANYSILHVSSQDLIDRNGLGKAKMLVMGGGADVFYHRRLQGKGCHHIREWVFQGGIYLGICAGAYFGAAKVEFALGSEIEVNEKRELKFFPGTAIGPCLKPYVYNSEEGASSAKIRLPDHSTFFSYYNGGCTFKATKEINNVDILGKYVDLEDKPAIIKCPLGKGHAILSGVHFEYPGELIFSSNQCLRAICTREKVNQTFIPSILRKMLL